MGSSLSRNVFAPTLAAAMLTACAGSGGNGNVPNAASPLAAARARFGQDSSNIALSGKYVGKFRNKGQGVSKVLLILSQSQDTLGGAVISKEGSQGLGGVIAWTASGHTITGTGVGPEKGTGSGYCTFSMSGTYKYRRLTGTYSATYGCSGQTGTFKFWHNCYFKEAGSEDIRPEGGVKPC
jgi:hypothetical protein